MSDPVVRDNTAESRYEIHVDDELAGFTIYRLDDDASPKVLTFVHTEIEPAFGGQGIGSKLAGGALADVRARGLRVLAECEFIAGYLEKHHEYDDLLAGDA